MGEALDARGGAPFAPEGWGAVGRVSVLLLWAVLGWEAIAQLSAEFENPERDVPRSTLFSVGIIAVLYVGVAASAWSYRNWRVRSARKGEG